MDARKRDVLKSELAGPTSLQAAVKQVRICVTGIIAAAALLRSVLENYLGSSIPCLPSLSNDLQPRLTGPQVVLAEVCCIPGNIGSPHEKRQEKCKTRASEDILRVVLDRYVAFCH